MSKIYAAKFSDGSYWLGDTWPECEEIIKGKAGVKYKSFALMEDAKAWISGVRPKKKGLRVYVDGSFMPVSEYSGWSWIAVEDGVEIASDCGKTPHPAASRNIDGELYAAWKAMEFLANRKCKGVICHDYQGVASWATGEWKTNSAVSQIYVNRISDLKEWATFEKISGHSGDVWNERADALAKGVLLKEESEKKKILLEKVVINNVKPIKLVKPKAKKAEKKAAKAVKKAPKKAAKKTIKKVSAKKVVKKPVKSIVKKTSKKATKKAVKKIVKKVAKKPKKKIVRKTVKKVKPVKTIKKARKR